MTPSRPVVDTTRFSEFSGLELLLSIVTTRGDLHYRYATLLTSAAYFSAPLRGGVRPGPPPVPLRPPVSRASRGTLVRIYASPVHTLLPSDLRHAACASLPLHSAFLTNEDIRITKTSIRSVQRSSYIRNANDFVCNLRITEVVIQTVKRMYYHMLRSSKLFVIRIN